LDSIARKLRKSHSSESEESEDHLSIEVLDDYHQGDRLSREEESRVQHHIVLCRHCQERLLDLVRFLKDGKESRFWSAELTSAWEQWLSALRKQDTSGSVGLGEDS
jgi:hypothetical protein